MIGVLIKDYKSKNNEYVYGFVHRRIKGYQENGEECKVFVDALEDSSVRLGCRLWVAASDYWTVKWRLTEEIKAVFDENHIEIPYNHLTVSLKQE